MDKFEELQANLAKMTPKQAEEAVNGLKKICDCPTCPTYNDCAKKAGEKLFCALGKSKNCIKSEEGCACATCPVTAQLGLNHYYYCLRGSEKEVRMK
jgi:hypothetical protein